jgi:protein TonB
VSAVLHAIAAALLVTAPSFVPDALPEARPVAEKIDFWPMTRPIVRAVTPPSPPGPVHLRRNRGGARPGTPLPAPIVLPQVPPLVPVEDLQPGVFFEPPPIGDCIGDCVPGDGPGVEAPGPADPGANTGEGRGGLRPGGNVKAPVKLRHVSPVYPDPARWAGVEGVVLIECLINPQGRVVDVRVLRGHPLLETAALEAVRQWVYRPTLLNGVPVAVVLTVTVRFQLRR